MIRSLAACLAAVSTVALATPADAGTTVSCTTGSGCTQTPSPSADVIVGSNGAANFLFKQRDGDCEEGSTDAIIGAVKGARVKETTIDLYARNAGILGRDGTRYGSGSNWFGPDGVVKLFAHYGLKATVGSHSIATIEKDLKSGDHVEAFVNANTLWATLTEAQLVETFGPAPAGDEWVTGPAAFPAGSDPDHAVVLDSINVTKSLATVTDSGTGLTYTVKLSVWRQAVAASGSSYAVVTTKR